MNHSILTMKNIKKTYYPDIIAVRQANFSLNMGEIHALAGENGAGKTTLMKILYGLEKADSGHIYMNQEKVSIQSPNDAMKHHIGMVHQHFMLVEDMTVADNIVLGMEPKHKGLYDYKKACEMTNSLSEKYAMDIDPEAKISDLTVGLKQKVEILKVLARDSKIIILDEPTAVLTPQETKELFHQLKLLKASNHTIIMITHKLREIKEICDRVTIMKSGQTLETYQVKDISIQDISKKMIGYDFEIKPIKSENKLGHNVLEIKNLSYRVQNKYLLKDINLTIKSGQILGVVGVEGNGQNILSKILKGDIVDYEGDIFINDKTIKGASIRDIRAQGLAFIPEDRMVDGVNLKSSILESSMVLKARQKAYQKGPFLNVKKLINFTKSLIDDYQIHCDSYRDSVHALSGGNIQKIVSAREISESEHLLIANQPTRGIDVGAVLSLHEKLKDLQNQGKAILLISSDLKEIYDLTQSVVVFYNGEIVARIDQINHVSEDQLGRYMLGIERQKSREGQ